MSTTTKEKSVNRSDGIYACQDRTSPGHTPRDISNIKERYLPLDATNSTVQTRSTIFGAALYRTEVKAGDIFEAHEGRRVVLEVGCKTIIYIHIEPGNSAKHHKIFIQSDEGFNFDITLRRDAAEIAKNTRHIETLVKYEIYFIMGVLSTAGWGAWLIITGSDVTVMVARNKAKSDAAKQLAKTLLKEISEMNRYAPTLAQKIMALVEAELTDTSRNSVKHIPESLANSEKARAQVAGVLFGKWWVDPKNISAWSMLSVVLVQAGTNSLTHLPDALLLAANKKYADLINAIKNANLSDPMSMVRASRELVHIAMKTGITITASEAEKIVKEIKRHPDKVFKNMENIARALVKFEKAMGV